MSSSIGGQEGVAHMRKAIIVFGMILGLLLVDNRNVDAQKKGKNSATPTLREFDISVSKLPPKFKGDNDRIRAICESLPKEQIKRGDFESDAEFEMRKANALSRLRSYAFSNIEKPPTEVEKIMMKTHPDLFHREP
jgi:hypothetical protein